MAIQADDEAYRRRRPTAVRWAERAWSSVVLERTGVRRSRGGDLPQPSGHVVRVEELASDIEADGDSWGVLDLATLTFDDGHAFDAEHGAGAGHGASEATDR